MKNIKFKLEDIKLLRSEVRDHPVVFSENFDLEDIQIEFDFKFNYSDNFLQNFMHFNFEIDVNEKLVSLGHFDIIFTFKVDDLQGLLTDEEAKKILHLNIISLAYSTSRGILFSESKGFTINEIYLNPISPISLYEEHIKEMSENQNLSITSDNHDHDS